MDKPQFIYFDQKKRTGHGTSSFYFERPTVLQRQCVLCAFHKWKEISAYSHTLITRYTTPKDTSRSRSIKQLLLFLTKRVRHYLFVNGRISISIFFSPVYLAYPCKLLGYYKLFSLVLFLLRDSNKNHSSAACYLKIE